MSELITEQTVTMPIFPKGPANAMSPEDRRRYYNPWMRFFARSIDFFLAQWIFSSLFNLIIYAISLFIPTSVLTHWQNGLMAYLQIKAHTPHDFHVFAMLVYVITILAFMIYITLWCLIVEPFLISRWGYTPGKYLFNLKVIQPDGQLLSRKEAFARGWRVWFYGCAIGLPLVNIITYLKAYFHLRREAATSWDKNHFIVAHTKCGWIRKTIIFLLCISPLLFFIISFMVMRLTHVIP